MHWFLNHRLLYETLYLKANIAVYDPQIIVKGIYLCIHHIVDREFCNIQSLESSPANSMNNTCQTQLLVNPLGHMSTEGLNRETSDTS